jgi:NAD(P)-dependent dehydrogenase (short-subunit alcohol dehydrogenase family)
MNQSRPRAWFITGCSRGLGRAFALAALSAGDTVVATARDVTALDYLRSGGPGRGIALRLDVTDRSAVRAAVRQAEDLTGGIGVLVNNAGYGLAGSVEEVSEEQARAQLDTNVLGALWCTQAVIPGMRERGAGHIVQVSSIAGITSYPNLGMYCASKWALEGLSDSLAQEVAGFGIHVTLLELGEFRTDWSAGSMVRATPMSAYDDVLARSRNGLSGAFADCQPGDPEKAALALLRVAAADPPPRRVLLGRSAAESAPRVYGQRLDEWLGWAELARSVDFDA